MQIYVDLDGVLADFDTHYEKLFGYRPQRPGGCDWKLVNGVEDFYLTMGEMPDLNVLWDRLFPHNPIILTGIPRQIDAAENDKRRWIKAHLPLVTKVICCQSKDKYQYCKPGDLLIDDYVQHKQKWINAGGIWITHTSALTTCHRLSVLGII